ncbi:Aste57867_14230 [Aphanomyces stellatus]|uniref:Aste57867_14230 protein n=1 Tax=Aphanomyces stellatus TaxID=120398 RepID=A0A485L1T6_9STRA|nr:hypothetical protein As57867_014179 [Aphanomyces stellatus]VFT91055.1 Aste57867_14230 [Aphanomyces stellatus]
MEKKGPPPTDKHVIPETNKGYKMLETMGWKAGDGLGTEKQGRTEPVATCFKRDRAGLGKKRLQMRVTHTFVATPRPSPPPPPPQPKLTREEKLQRQRQKTAVEKKHVAYARDLYSDMPEGYEVYFQDPPLPF